MHSWGTFPILYECQHSAVLPYISLISLSIGSYLELAIFREYFSPVARVNVRFSWVFYFVFICSDCILNLPHYIMGGTPRPVFIRGFPNFLKSRFSSRILVCWIQWGREKRIILKRFVTVVAWKFLKISCCIENKPPGPALKICTIYTAYISDHQFIHSRAWKLSWRSRAKPNEANMPEKAALIWKINRIRQTDKQQVNTKYVAKATSYNPKITVIGLCLNAK